VARAFITANGAMPTTAALTPVTTGTAIKTMLQIATPSTVPITIIGWGISFDGSAAATPIRCELIQTDVAATVTAHVAAGVQPYNDLSGTASLMTLGTTATGYTATSEGSTTATRWLDAPKLIAPSNGMDWIWPLGREPVVPVSKFVRVRVTATAAVLCYCYIIYEE
jgi:hypothetical protein